MTVIAEMKLPINVIVTNPLYEEETIKRNIMAKRKYFQFVTVKIKIKNNIEKSKVKKSKNFKNWEIKLKIIIRANIIAVNVMLKTLTLCLSLKFNFNLSRTSYFFHPDFHCWLIIFKWSACARRLYYQFVNCTQPQSSNLNYKIKIKNCYNFHMSKKVKVYIEIPKGSNIKYEYDRENNEMVVDRILRDGFVYPANYGSLREALDWDGDELDILVYSSEQFMPGVALNARIIGAMQMIDDGEVDTKLIGVHEDDYRLSHINTLDDLKEYDSQWLEEVRVFFSTYKNWKREGITKVSGFNDLAWAIKEYDECVELMQKYGSLKKQDFINKMKELHPEKYE